MRPTQPEFPETLERVTQPLPLMQDCLDLGDDLRNVLVQGQNLSGQTLARLSVRCAEFRDCRFSGVLWTRCDLVDVAFENCDLSNCDLSDGYLSRVRFTDCRAVGLRLTKSVGKDAGVQLHRPARV